MRQTMRRYEKFYFYDSDGVEAHLAKMAAKGWQLEAITPLYWKYRKAPPEALRYAVSYLAGVSDLDGRPNEGQEVLREYCAQAGWDFVAQWAQMQIFVTRRGDAPALETDEASRLQATHKTMKKSFLPGTAAILFLVAMQLFQWTTSLRRNAVETLVMGTALFLLAAWALIGVSTLLEGGGYLWWYVRSKAAVEQGGQCLDSGGFARWGRRIGLCLGGLALGLLAAGFLTGSLRGLALPMLVGILGVAGLVYLVSRGVKALGESAWINGVATMIVAVAAMMLLTKFLVGITYTDFWQPTPDEVYEFQAPDGSVRPWEIFQDPIPLKLEDLGPVESAHYSYKGTRESSLFVLRYSGVQRSTPRASDLYYTVVDVRWPVFLEACWEDFAQMPEWMVEWPPEEQYGYQPVEEPAWGADRVYRRFTGGAADSQYLVCWGNRIVEISLEEPPTPAQIAIIREKLTGPLTRP